MNPLVHSLENQFHGAANAASLRELYRKGDFTGLLEYALRVGTPVGMLTSE